jgi:hypothetical protein
MLFFCVNTIIMTIKVLLKINRMLEAWSSVQHNSFENTVKALELLEKNHPELFKLIVLIHGLDEYEARSIKHICEVRDLTPDEVRRREFRAAELFHIYLEAVIQTKVQEYSSIEP